MGRDFNSATPDYIEVTTRISGGFPWSMGGWFKVDALDTEYQLFGEGHNTAGNEFHRIIVASDNTLQLKSRRGAGQANAILASPTVTTGWHHALGVVVGQSDRTIYLDGGSKANNTDTANAIIHRTTIGAVYGGGVSNTMNGLLAEVAMWNVALTDGEARLLAAGVSPIRVRPASLVGYWPLYGISSPETDYSTAGNDMTVVGSPAQADHAPVAPAFGFDAGWRGAVALVGGDVNIAIPVGAISWAGQVPTADNPVSVAIPAGGVLWAGFIPVADVSANVFVAIPAGGVAWAGQVPTLDNPVNLPVPVGGMVWAGFAPIVDVGADVTVQVPLGGVSWAGLVPALDNPVNLPIPVGGVSWAGQVPTVSLPIVVAIPVGGVSWAGLVPSLDNPVNLPIPLGGVTWAGFAPVVQAGADVTVQIPLGGVSWAGLVPTLDLAINVAVPVGGVSWTGLVPTLDNPVIVAIPVGGVVWDGKVPVVLTLLFVIDRNSLRAAARDVGLSAGFRGTDSDAE